MPKADKEPNFSERFVTFWSDVGHIKWWKEE